MALPTGVRKLASGRFQWRAEVRGQRRTGTARTSQQAAQDRAQAIIELGGTPTADPTVNDLIVSWRTAAQHARRTAENRDAALALIPDAFLDRHARDITPPIVASLWREMANAGVGAQTLYKTRGYLSRAFAQGVQYGLVPTNPIRTVPLPTQTSKTLKPEDVPTATDVASLIGYFATNGPPELHGLVHLMAATGARPGEASALRWSAVDFDDGTIMLGPNLDRGRNGAVTAGKNDEAGWRYFHASHGTLAILRALPQHCEWVFAPVDKDRPRSPDSLSKTIRRAILACGLEFRPYDLRHFFASTSLARGVPVPDVAHVMGDNPATVLGTYTHFVKSKRNEAAVTVGDLLTPDTSNVVELRAQ